jgi:hypothetical protein
MRTQTTAPTGPGACTRRPASPGHGGRATARRRAAALIVLGAALLLPACGGGHAGVQAEQAPPAKVQHLASGIGRITLSASAARRIGIRTAAVERAGRRTAVPYSAVIYDGDGRTWTYINPEPLAFERRQIDVVRIDGARAILRSGPTEGTRVVTVGVEELFGTEFEFDEE